jgi:hypothetical protein
MSTPQITLADCLTEINNALNYWYPLPVRDSKLDEEFGSDRPYGASREECDARHVRLFQFRDRLQQQLRASGKDAAFDLAMAMAELANVAKERDNARQSLRAAEQDVTEIDTLCNDFRRANARLVEERDAARSFNDILKGVNLRLTADLAAATQRADTAEAILRAKA